MSMRPPSGLSDPPSCDELLDTALDLTFPASDPPAIDPQFCEVPERKDEPQPQRAPPAAGDFVWPRGAG
jgi:hypothetical protein